MISSRHFRFVPSYSVTYHSEQTSAGTQVLGHAVDTWRQSSGCRLSFPGCGGPVSETALGSVSFLSRENGLRCHLAVIVITAPAKEEKIRTGETLNIREGKLFLL